MISSQLTGTILVESLQGSKRRWWGRHSSRDSSCWAASQRAASRLQCCRLPAATTPCHGYSAAAHQHCERFSRRCACSSRHLRRTYYISTECCDCKSAWSAASSGHYYTSTSSQSWNTDLFSGPDCGLWNAPLFSYVGLPHSWTHLCHYGMRIFTFLQTPLEKSMDCFIIHFFSSGLQPERVFWW